MERRWTVVLPVDAPCSLLFRMEPPIQAPVIARARHASEERHNWPAKAA